MAREKTKLEGGYESFVRVFLDENNNGEFDTTEPLIKDVKLHASQAYRHAVNNAKGVAILTSMQINRQTDIVLDETSIAEPFIIPAHEGVSITPRAGYVEYIDFPLVNSSEVEGSVYLADGKVLPYAKVKLIDEKGSEVASTESAYDGYYLLTGLKPGEYTATVEQSQMEQKSLKAKQRVHVELPNEGEILSEVNLSLQALSKVDGVVASLGAFSSLPILKNILCFDQ